MCRICDGEPPDPSSFERFKNAVLNAAENVTEETLFVNEAIRIDKLRFDRGDEWGEPHIYRDVNYLIFNNLNADEGLLLFTLSCWLDMQAPYTTVWTKYLRQTKEWIDGRGNIPRGKYRHTNPHLLLTVKTSKEYGSLGQWFIHKIENIVKNNGQKSGNIYRLAGEMCMDLYSKPKAATSLKNGCLPNNFSGGDHKRFWMFLMLLKRDNSIVKCLFTRALNKFPNGMKATQYWYDSKYFNPEECELPVDIRVLKNWKNMLKKMQMANLQTEIRSRVARDARTLAQKYDISPSIFDAILFFNTIEKS